MRFELGQHMVTVEFCYDLVSYRGETRQGTYCTICTMAFPVVIGIATCHPNDQFNKEKGRQVALAHAIEGYDIGTRTAIWHAYHMLSDKTVDRIPLAHRGLTPDHIYHLAGGRSLGISGYRNVEIHYYKFWPFYAVSYLDHDGYIKGLNLGV